MSDQSHGPGHWLGHWREYFAEAARLAVFMVCACACGATRSKSWQPTRRRSSRRAARV